MAKRFSNTGLRFIKEEEFESEAMSLLHEYGRTYGEVTAPPVPVDEIVEMQLRLTLEFRDMQQLFGVADVHGALWVNEKCVGVDQKLDPSQHPAMLGRYHFTLAHEAGHWRLHRHLFEKHANQLSLLPEGMDRPEYICRSSDKTQIEYQADRFASCLLIPSGMLDRAWEAWRGNTNPLNLRDLRSPNNKGETDESILEREILPLARTFEVSAEAMRIRAETLGFLSRSEEASFF